MSTAYAPPKVTRAAPEKKKPSVDSVLSRPVAATIVSTGAHHTVIPTASTSPLRRTEGRSACSASSATSGAGPSSSSASGVIDPGRCRPSSQPTPPAASTTTGKGTANSDRARNDTTAMLTSEARPSARRPTRTTAWATMASTAAEMPPNTAVTSVVVPNAT